MRILIIDDDSEGTEYLSTFLQLEGFTVHTATCGEEGLKLLQQLTPELVILDILLPDIDGCELCRQIRPIAEVPILILSGFAVDVEDQVRGLNSGADDYLLKPVDFDLLKARILALLRRHTANADPGRQQVYVDTHLIIDLYRAHVCVAGRPIHLSHLEYQLLALLVSNCETVPTLEIADMLWSGIDNDDVYAGYVRTYISRLRKAIEPDPKQPCYIINEFGLGYRFVRQTGYP